MGELVLNKVKEINKQNKKNIPLLISITPTLPGPDPPAGWRAGLACKARVQ
jgi:hypothetical protein